MTLLQNQPNFFIYDYETFGLNPALDRPAQFAGIRVDDKLCPIAKKEIFFCQIPHDYLPNPESVLTTGITPQYTLQYGLTESEFAYRIFNIFNKPNTCIVGYNNINFDDEFTRHTFYRNFCDPYLWAYNHGNSRWDLLPILRAYYSLYPEKIYWPINNKNKISFRLIDLTYANHIEHLNVHDAMSDVYATLEIMKLTQKTHPYFFQFLYNHRTKDQLKKIINFDFIDPLIFISNTINDTYNNFIKFLAPISWHPNNKNILIAYDLNSKPDLLLNLNINKLYQNLYQGTQNLSDLFKQIPLQLIKLNSCPILIPIHLIKKENIFYYKNSLFSYYQYCLKNLNFIQTNINHTYLKNKIKTFYTTIESYFKLKQTYQKVHVDNQLYFKFFNFSDRQLINKIRNTNIQQLSKIKINSTDTRLKLLFFFYKARNFPYSLNVKEQKSWLDYKRLLLQQSKFQNYLTNIDNLLLHQNNLIQINLLHKLKQYYKHYLNTI
ncbi:exodeoxyribonuclease I [Candidatus Blochmanniella vafra str. BVAF]|uniref:Exodeoxyribonuclease I n=1 Tax=Blochmanniella vafra (strain BVAF) TaxID=859654 RepID=E8Q724_BLOVB|nr:exodeoxyribonuclease I [Candidatus Blochmannia vafer]ADV33848.1 exodeoxyribonuclease I [Candidatus Blochmannia vafer str. BVAF]